MQENYYSRILVAVDGSTSSMHATDYAISIALKNNSQLYPRNVHMHQRVHVLPDDQQLRGLKLNHE
jgi:nucleotide-binding universal stress UspA family protein